VTVPLSDDAEASIIARERLRILMIGFYVRGAMIVAFGCFFSFTSRFSSDSPSYQSPRGLNLRHPALRQLHCPTAHRLLILQTKARHQLFFSGLWRAYLLR
jgi:hypothetical protein